MQETLENIGDSLPLRLESSKKFQCVFCDYITQRQWNYNKHISTAKHKKNYKNYKKLQMSKKKVVIYECPFCPKIFKSKGGKYKHIKKCSKNPKINKKLEFLKKQLEEERKLTKKLEQKIENHENEKTKLKFMENLRMLIIILIHGII